MGATQLLVDPLVRLVLHELVRLEPSFDPESDELMENEPYEGIDEQLGGPHPPPSRSRPGPGAAGRD